MKQLLNLKQTLIHWNKMQLSETMKDVMKQLCIFEKQLAKHRKKGLGIFLYNKNHIWN